jgi:hypothetical protein
MPDWLYAEEMRFQTFLEEGGWDPTTDFKVEVLDGQQAAILVSLVRREFPDENLGFCLRALQRVIDSQRKA